MKKVAICLHGAVSKAERHFYERDSLYLPGKYINYTAAYNSIQKHIISCNTDYEFNFFIHCWNLDLQDKLIGLYKPKSYLFEDNSKYNDEINSLIRSPELFGGASRALSIKKSIELFENFKTSTYNKIIIYRPDVILFKNIDLKNYNENKIYVNNINELNRKAGMTPGGDFHFIMNENIAYKFKHLYDYINKGNPVKHHFWIQNYIKNFMDQNLTEDDIHAGFHQEVLRKVNITMVKNNRLSIETLLSYGLSIEEIDTYNVH